MEEDGGRGQKIGVGKKGGDGEKRDGIHVGKERGGKSRRKRELEREIATVEYKVVRR